jgi:myo-inositol-1(or 4)-monophosphatase
MTDAHLQTPPAELLADLRRLAEESARQAGAIARAAFGGRQRFELKSDRSEVTAIDRAAERTVVEWLRQNRPGDVFLGEEAIANSTPADYATPGRVVWVIDPLDGTRNFVHGVPCFGSIVAAMLEGVPVAGAIYDPCSDVMYSAAAGQGATANGRELRVPDESNDPRGAERKLLVAIPSVRERIGAELVQEVLARHVVRSFGSSALHLALVAGGGIDATILNNCKLWDIAAGWPIVREAGGDMLPLEAGANAARGAGGPLFPIDLAQYRRESIPIIAGSAAALARLTNAG